MDAEGFDDCSGCDGEHEFPCPETPMTPELKAWVLEQRVEPKDLTCQACLDGRHRTCKGVSDPAWEGGGGKCACNCRNTGLVGVRLRKRNEGTATPAAPYVPKRGRPVKWTDAKLVELLQLRNDGLTAKQIAEKVGSERSIVQRYTRIATKRGLIADQAVSRDGQGPSSTKGLTA